MLRGGAQLLQFLHLHIGQYDVAARALPARCHAIIAVTELGLWHRVQSCGKLQHRSQLFIGSLALCAHSTFML